MAILTPPQINVDAALNAAGMGTSASNGKDSIKDIFKSHGAGIEDIARTTGSLMASAESDSTKLQATRFAAEVYGLIADKNAKASDVPEITINIVSAAGGVSQNLIGVLMPRTGQLES